MISVIHHPHDKLFRLSMEEPRVAQEFFSAYLPVDLLKKINLRLLKLENHSFIIAFRLLVYRVRLMERHLKKYPDQPLPLIYPFVVYNGEQRWEAPIDLFALFGEQGELAKEWLLKPARLLDIQALPDEEMRSRQWSGLIEFALKHRKVVDFNKFLDHLFPWIHTLEQTGSAGFSLSKIVIKYVLNGTDAKETELFTQKMYDYLSPELRSEVMTLAQQFEQQGQQKGIHLGIRQGEVAVILQMLKHRFKQIPEACLKRIEQADDKTLLSLVEKILDAKTIEDVFKTL